VDVEVFKVVNHLRIVLFETSGVDIFHSAPAIIELEPVELERFDCPLRRRLRTVPPILDMATFDAPLLS
jgi:hypothetical protein